MIQQLRDNAASADELHRRSRRLLVESARRGAAEGLTQREISAAIGRSQPEVSRLLRFHGETPLARALVSRRGAILTAIRAAGGRTTHVFGSVSRGDDGPGSDVDLLVDFGTAPSLLEISRLEEALSAILGARVDVVPEGSLRPNIAERARADAVPL